MQHAVVRGEKGPEPLLDIWMLSREQCHRCFKRFNPGASKCVGCGAHADDRPATANRRGMGGWATIAVAVIALLTMLAIGFSDRYVTAVSDWYTDMVIRFRAEAPMHFIAVSDDKQAFQVCARSVVKRLEEESSVATFPAGGTLALGDGRYRVDSFVDEAGIDGVTHRRSFSCTVHFSGSRWVLEDLTIEIPRGGMVLR
jgi:hypothetical protein